MPQPPPRQPSREYAGMVMGMLNEILVTMRNSRAQERPPQQQEEVKLHRVTERDADGNERSVAKSLPQILTDLDLSVQDLTDAVDTLADLIGEEEEGTEERHPRKKGRRPHRINAS